MREWMNNPMSTTIPYITPPAKDFRDRSATLLVIGILMILTGCGAGCFAVMTPLSLLVPRPPNMPGPRPIDMIVGALIYALFAAAFLYVGIGSVRKRRWVQPIVLICGWMWMAIGLVAAIFWMVMLPDMGKAMTTAMANSVPPGTAAPVLPPAMLRAMLAGITILTIAIYLIIPALLVWFYSGLDMRKTLHFHDAQPRWTDRCPTRPLGLAMGFFFVGVGILMMEAQGILPLFGTYLVGPLARTGILLLALAYFAVAWLTYRLRPAGWWIGVMLILLAFISAAVTLTRVDLFEMYRAAGMPPQQLEMMRQMRVIRTPMFIVSWTGAMTVAALVYAWVVRGYFMPGGAQRDQDRQTA
jgi:hypothetical protein